MMNETSHYIAVVGFLTYMRQCAGPFRVRVMPADHRSAPSHYLCQWLFIVDWTLVDKLRRNLTWNVPFRQIHVQFSSTKRWSGPFQYICNALRSCIILGIRAPGNAVFLLKWVQCIVKGENRRANGTRERERDWERRDSEEVGRCYWSFGPVTRTIRKVPVVRRWPWCVKGPGMGSHCIDLVYMFCDLHGKGYQ